ncbi:protease [Liquorilactobacillus sucicola DSM 21376 = JCM 15457]|uniref:CAAX amino protease n=1 Tax=Liquorilactobacillus sucicola DSM 21376 = JCM 15457 TaxID=1423806 RepID=A0A023CZ37_9LACO|nr:type II CAAX endopeptidase family protein [Liquorilactobacillus sucicola]KRN06589.1 CAAX amino protease [Liquorilactobacillus sucicola DSM 21376 = JCM 15457]GAJ27157.1 protease [Liquorilactobacillus sucicola DSM 21376 = JCM 15457]
MNPFNRKKKKISERKKVNQKIGKILLITAIYFIVFQVTALFAGIVMMNGNGSNASIAAIEKSGVPYFIAVACGLLVVIAVSSPRLRRKIFTETNVKMTPIAFVCLLAVMMSGQVVASLYGSLLERLVNLIGYSVTAQMQAASAHSQTFSMLVYASLIGPLSEEIVFRGFLLRTLEPYGQKFAIIVSAYMFGLYHANLFQSPFAFLLGLILGYTAQTYGLKWSFALHVFNNFVLGDFMLFILRNVPTHQAETISGMILLFGGLLGISFLWNKRDEIKDWLEKHRIKKTYLKDTFLGRYNVIITIAVFILACMGLEKL